MIGDKVVAVGEDMETKEREDTEVLRYKFILEDSKADSSEDEDDYDQRAPRRRYEEPLSNQIRKQLLQIAESKMKRVEDEVSYIAKKVCDNHEDQQLRESFCDLTLQLVVEQPFKIPFVAAVVLVVNTMQKEIVEGILSITARRINEAIADGEWRDVKLYLKFLGSLQGLLDGEGVFPLLQDLLAKAIDLQTENNEEVSTRKFCKYGQG